MLTSPEHRGKPCVITNAFIVKIFSCISSAFHMVISDYNGSYGFEITALPSVQATI